MTLMQTLATWWQKNMDVGSRWPAEPKPEPPKFWNNEVAQAGIQAWMGTCSELMLQMEMNCGCPLPVGFDADEQVVFCLPGVELMEARAVRYSQRNTQGRSAGSSIRIMKGLSIRTGGGVSHSNSVGESIEKLKVIDEGTLVLTNKRLAFFGSIRTNSVKLSDIIAMEPFDCGFELHRERKQKSETYYFTLPLMIMEGAGAGFTITGLLTTTSIQMAKIYDTVDPKTLRIGRERLAKERLAKERGLSDAQKLAESNVVPFNK
jgi:hypothetical protein